MSVLNTIVAALKSELSAISTDNGYQTDILTVYDYPVALTKLGPDRLPCLSLLPNGDSVVLVRDSSGKRLQAPYIIVGNVKTSQSGVQAALLNLAKDVRDLLDGLSASDLSSGCLSISWDNDTPYIAVEIAAFSIDVTITYYCAEGAN